ncbi:MAG: type I-C CRISPR-associated protein Cas5c [Pseudomonadota bacterium]
MRGKTHCLEVWGDFACFTRPEMKVERFSYPLITPSAARGIFDAIYWKKSYGFYWQIEMIEILKPPKYIALRRNEVKDKVPRERTILAWRDGRDEIKPLWADGDRDSLGTDQKGRTQRQTMALKEIRYRLYAHMCMREDGQETRALDAQFERRVQVGKCFYQPFFGCREFPAFFGLVETEQPAAKPIGLDLELGWMLYDVFDLSRANESDAKASISVFHARVFKGVMQVPPYADPAVRKGIEETAYA